MEMSAINAESKMDNISFQNLEEVLKRMIYIINQNKSYSDYILSLVHNKNNYEDEDDDNYDYYDDKYEYEEDEKCKCGEYYYRCVCKNIKDMYDKELDDYYNNFYYNKYD